MVMAAGTGDYTGPVSATTDETVPVVVNPLIVTTLDDVINTEDELVSLREAILAACRKRVTAETARLESPEGAEEVAARFAARDALRGRRLRAELPDGTSVAGENLGVNSSGPKFAKRYAEIGAAMKSAMSEYVAEVRSRTFPLPR